MPRKSIYDNLWSSEDHTNYDKRQKRRQKYFNMIAPKDNWKNPIDTWVPDQHLFDCVEACVFFTGSIPMTCGKTPGWSRIKADGYYKAIGA